MGRGGESGSHCGDSGEGGRAFGSIESGVRLKALLKEAMLSLRQTRWVESW